MIIAEDVQALHTLKMRKNIQEKLQDKTATFKVNNLSRVIVNLKDQNNAPSKYSELSTTNHVICTTKSDNNNAIHKLESL